MTATARHIYGFAVCSKFINPLNPKEMNKFILILLVAISSIGYSQTVKQDASGNYILADKVPGASKSEAISIGKTFTDAKGTTHPVYKSKNGKLFIIKTSQKTGKTYNYYLKV